MLCSLGPLWDCGEEGWGAVVVVVVMLVPGAVIAAALKQSSTHEVGWTVEPSETQSMKGGDSKRIRRRRGDGKQMRGEEGKHTVGDI